MDADSERDSGPGSDLVEMVRALGAAAWGSGWHPRLMVAAPGRVELLGNHIDYCGGSVLAGAVDRHLVMLSDAGGDDDVIEVAFVDPTEGRQTVDRVAVTDLVDWRQDCAPQTPTDYLRGAVGSLTSSGRSVGGGKRIAFAGDIPTGMGLSSSAALVVALVLTLSDDSPAFRETILLAQGAENRAGVSSGTMDQAASLAGGVILYDAAAVEATSLSPRLDDVDFVVISSGVQHQLGESEYPVRVRETRTAQEIAQRAYGADAVPVLAALTERQLDALASSGTLDETLAARARHVVTEVERVGAGRNALMDEDWEAFGALMTESGRSSAGDYDISAARVEELVSVALDAPGVLGARMMGGGGGGSVLVLVRDDGVGDLRARVAERYFGRYDLDGDDAFLVVRTFAEGASRRDDDRQAGLPGSSMRPG